PGQRSAGRARDRRRLSPTSRRASPHSRGRRWTRGGTRRRHRPLGHWGRSLRGRDDRVRRAARNRWCSSYAHPCTGYFGTTEIEPPFAMQPADPASFPSGSKERSTQSNRTRPPDTDWPATRRPICPSSVPPLQRHGFLLVKTLSVIPNRLSVLRKSSCCVALASSPCARPGPATTIGNRILLLIVASCARLWAEARSGWRRSIPREQCTLAAWRAVSRTRAAADDERHRRQQGGKASITCRMAV